MSEMTFKWVSEWVSKVSELLVGELGAWVKWVNELKWTSQTDSKLVSQMCR